MAPPRLQTLQHSSTAASATGIVTVVIEGPPHQIDTEKNRFFEKTQLVLKSLGSAGSLGQAAIASPRDRYGPAKPIWQSATSPGIKKLYQELSLSALQKPLHLNRFQFGHANSKACLTLESPGGCITDISLEKLEQENLKYDSRMTVSSGCNTGENISDIDLQDTAAMYAGSFGEINRSDIFKEALLFYLSGKYSGQEYNFNGDSSRTADEAFAYAVDHSDGPTSLSVLLYLQPISAQGKEQMGPWHRKNAAGKIQVVATERVSGYDAAEKLSHRLKAGQMILAKVKQPGSPLEPDPLFADFIQQGMFLPAEIELNPEEMQRYGLTPDSQGQYPQYLLIDRYHSATSVQDLGDKKQFQADYKQAASYTQPEKVALYCRQWASGQLQNRLQVLQWMTDDDPAVFIALSSLLQEALESPQSRLRQQARETIKMTLESLSYDKGIGYALALPDSPIIQKFLKKTIQNFSVREWSRFLQFVSLIKKYSSEESFYRSMIPHLLAKAATLSNPELNRTVQLILFQVALTYPTLEKTLSHRYQIDFWKLSDELIAPGDIISESLLDKMFEFLGERAVLQERWMAYCIPALDKLSQNSQVSSQIRSKAYALLILFQKNSRLATVMEKLDLPRSALAQAYFKETEKVEEVTAWVVLELGRASSNGVIH